MQIHSQPKFSRTLLVLSLEPSVSAPALVFVCWRAYHVVCSFNEVITPCSTYMRFKKKIITKIWVSVGVIYKILLLNLHFKEGKIIERNVESLKKCLQNVCRQLIWCFCRYVK